jgi:hypothetical protein
MIGEDERGRWVSENLDAVGHESFPDDEDVRWRALEIRHRAEFSFVEAEAEPATVGYAKFGFVFDWAAGRPPQLVGCYVTNDTRWSLLFSSGKVPAWSASAA